VLSDRLCCVWGRSGSAAARHDLRRFGGGHLHLGRGSQRRAGAI